MTPEELGKIASVAWRAYLETAEGAATECFDAAWIDSALAVAAAVKRECADICLSQASVEGIAQSCADAILDTIPEGK